jgi:hypothetical protein
MARGLLSRQNWKNSLQRRQTFVGKMLIDNAINYTQDRFSREWTFNYYISVAESELMALGVEFSGTLCLRRLDELDATFHMRIMLSPALCDRLAVIRNISAAQYAAIKADVMRTSPITHRADADARYWAHLWLAVASWDSRPS